MNPGGQRATQVDSGVRLLSTGWQRMLVIAAALVIAEGIALFVLTEKTDRYFAWTIKPPLTAAFLGAGYLASAVVELLAARERTWARARVAVPAVLTFTTLTLIVTLLHLDRFHFQRPFLPTGAVTWIWLAVYVLVPAAMVVLLVHELRLPGGDPPRSAPLPGWLRALLTAQALCLFAFGLPLLVAPGAASHFWPWQLTVLTAQATAAWLIGVAVLGFHAVLENDLARDRAALAMTFVLGVLQLVALLRYPADVDWSSPAAWLYVLVLLSLLIPGFYGLLGFVRTTPHALA